MNVLVTGGAGYIGSHLVDRLVREGHRVTVLDDLSTGKTTNLADSNAALHVGSILDEPLVRRLVDDAELVYHLAAAVGTTTLRIVNIEADSWLDQQFVAHGWQNFVSQYEMEKRFA